MFHTKSLSRKMIKSTLFLKQLANHANHKDYHLELLMVVINVSNGIPCFQRKIDNFIADNKLEKTFAFSNVMVWWWNKEEHHKLLILLESLPLYQKRTIWNFTIPICLLGSKISNHETTPDPAHLEAFKNMPSPEDTKN